jgi:hypothetical protein
VALATDSANRRGVMCEGDFCDVLSELDVHRDMDNGSDANGFHRVNRPCLVMTWSVTLFTVSSEVAAAD